MGQRHADADAGAAIGAIRPAVAFIYLPLVHETGSGIVVHTSASGSVILTAAHVVRASPDIQVYFNDDLNHPYAATIIRIDIVNDIALIRTSAAAPAQVSFADSVVSGEDVAVLGYPAAMALRLASRTGELRPEAALGSVTSIRLAGALLSTTAYTEPGDSGAPIFRQDNAEVVGLVTGHFGSSKRVGFQATGVSVLRRFLLDSGVTFYGARGVHVSAPHSNSTYHPIVGLQPLRDVRGAGRLLVDYVASTSYDQQYQGARPPFPDILGNVTAAAIRRTFDASVSSLSESINGPMSLSDLGAAAYQRGYVGAVQVKVALNVSAMFVLRLVVSADVSVVDRYGDVVFSGTGGRDNTFSFDVVGAPQKAVADAVDQIAAQARQDDRGLNFARYGIPLATGQSSALFSVVPASKGVRVSQLYPYGTAARAQLQLGDEIVALDGQDLAKLNPETISALFARHSGLFRCTVLEADGQPVVISFPQEDIRWYLNHPLRTRR
ncbi:MAG TPA: trypsin-like peptidase domain-containing protein [Candidatus Tyrphobacter sp.]